MVVLVDNRIKNEMADLQYPRYSLKFPDLTPRIEKLRGDCVSKRRSQRRRTWEKKVSMDDIRTELYTSRLLHLIENTLTYQYPQQPPPPQQAPPPMPSQQEMWAEIQRLRATASQAQQQVAEAQKREQMATYKIRRARGSNNLSFNWGENFRGAYLTPSKYQDGRVTIAGASMPAQIQLVNTPQGPFIVATIQNGPLIPEEVELYNEWFVKPIEVIPVRRGRQPATGQSNAPQQSPPQQAYAPAPLPPAQPQYAPQSQYTPPPAQPQYAPAPPQTSLPQPNATSSIAHLSADQQNALVAEASKLQQTAPQVYPSLDSALVAVKRAHNIP